MSRYTIGFVLIAFLMITEGCGPSMLCGTNRNWSVTYSETNPSAQEIAASIPGDVSAIVFIREFRFAACAGRMFVQIDGEEIGPVASYTHLVAYVQPGEHEVTSSGHSIWSTNIKSARGKLHLETFPGRAYFVSGIVDEGMVTVTQRSLAEAEELMKESRRILTQQEMATQ